MTRLLVLSEEYPSNQTNGQHLRVNALCRELCEDYECYFVYTGNSASTVEQKDDLGFAEQVCLPPRTRETLSWKRHFRLSNSRIIQQRSPEFYRTTTAELSRLAGKWAVHAVINFSPPFAEVATVIDLPKLLDYPDSSTLTIERSLRRRGSSMTLNERVHTRLQLRRQESRDRSTLKSVDLTTTIAEPDRNKLLEVSGIARDRVIVVPNGVNPEFLLPKVQSANRSRSVVFWGSLDFPPNWTAIQFFYEKIFLPYLAEQGIEWHIVGGGAGKQLEEIARHPLIHMAGFQADLVSFVADKGVMINPMTEGSGLKNKVLEAFAMRIPVVSTSLGIEAIEGNAGEHFLVTDTPSLFSQMVLQLLNNEDLAQTITDAANRLVLNSYSWHRVGRRFSDTVQRLL